MSLNRQVWISVSDIDGMSLKRKKTLAFLLKVKSAFKNSLVYDYTAKSLAKKLKLSEYQVRKHVKALRDMDMCYNEGANLRFGSLNRLFKHRKTVIKIVGKDSINSVVQKMDFLVIRQMVKRQYYLVNIVPKSNGQRRGKTKRREGMIDKTIVGMRCLGRKLGVSPTQASRVLRNLKAKNKIKTDKEITQLSVSFNEYLESKIKNGQSGEKLLIGYPFIHKGKVFMYHGTSIELVGEDLSMEYKVNRFFKNVKTFMDNLSIELHSKHIETLNTLSLP